MSDFKGLETFRIGFLMERMHVTSSPPCWCTVNKRVLISWVCYGKPTWSPRHCHWNPLGLVAYTPYNICAETDHGMNANWTPSLSLSCFKWSFRSLALSLRTDFDGYEYLTVEERVIFQGGRCNL